MLCRIIYRLNARTVEKGKEDAVHDAGAWPAADWQASEMRARADGPFPLPDLVLARGGSPCLISSMLTYPKPVDSFGA